MTYERCVRLGRWALLIALVPVLTFVFLTGSSSNAFASFGISISIAAAPLAFVLALVAVMAWLRRFRSEPIPVCAVIAHLLAAAETTLVILFLLALRAS
ncbi:MAG TPA: hypothetical protein VF384_11840 [Planctomycetota bacterium]